MRQDSIQPLLPLELERVIFELAAYTRPLSVPSLMLVAWRVKAWVEPLLYRVLLLSETWSVFGTGLHGAHQYPYEDNGIFSHTFAIPPAVLRTSVQHLCLPQTNHKLTKFLLSHCLFVRDLWALTDTEASLDLVGALRPRRFYCSVTAIFRKTTVDFVHSMVSQITHLEIFDEAEELPEESWFSLGLIPNLTHLTFNDEAFLPLFPNLFRTCASLRVLALVMLDFVVHPVETSDDLARDTRFVWIPCKQYVKDWTQGALTGEDYWSRADEFIERRKSGP
ncbi:hypothetical protein FB45DRAFT_1061718 [Roridomyces roridus]|uniref:Uncharacterized protein n=1 Tax=Roridomyces roridus TaxID=1738132 RepID=A0AAD7BI66_9AGAR|nr:hypothetical protein FB45DRAFT_1061718 [Roridomyces roridus]